MGSATAACNGQNTTVYSNVLTAELDEPVLNSVSVQSLPQHRPDFLPPWSAPTEIYVRGLGFSSATVANFSDNTGNTFQGTVTYNSVNSLRIDAPIVPSGVTNFYPATLQRQLLHRPPRRFLP